MSAVTFDTLKFVERLEKAGMPREQAAAFVQAQADSLSEAMDSTLATRSDIVHLESRMDLLSKDIQALELRLTVKLGAFITAAAGTTVALIKLL
ncbi:MAG: CCDC90 family protein [Rhodoferax sp.]|nr:CCDC90 family protein [Rhodoferax sp.]